MKKFDWFTILGALAKLAFGIAITENTILMITQGGWWILVGLMFGGVFAFLGYWNWKNRRLAQTLDYLSRNRVEVESAESCLETLVSAGMSMAEAIVACSQHSESRGCIGDVSCNWNARSPYIRCAMNPGGECQGCKDYEGA